MWSIGILMVLPAVVLGALDYPYQGGDYINDLFSRDLEPMPGPIAWGQKLMGGGAGEGDQYLSPDGSYHNKQEVKSDNILPAYCEPPNPCPPGFTSADGCMEEFENTAEFSREYQARQNCLCDEEHMFSCPHGHGKATGGEEMNGPSDETLQFTEAIDQLLSKSNIQDQHKRVIAKKFHERKRAAAGPRKKRSAKENPYLQGERLNSVAKKGNAWADE